MNLAERGLNSSIYLEIYLRAVSYRALSCSTRLIWNLKFSDSISREHIRSIPPLAHRGSHSPIRIKANPACFAQRSVWNYQGDTDTNSRNAVSTSQRDSLLANTQLWSSRPITPANHSGNKLHLLSHSCVYGRPSELYQAASVEIIWYWWCSSLDSSFACRWIYDSFLSGRN